MTLYLKKFEVVIARTDELLIQAYRNSVDDVYPITGGIRFPSYRTRSSTDSDAPLSSGNSSTARIVRVSEQEARFIMAGELAKSGLAYSVETPTQGLYQFTGKTAISANTDVTVYPCNTGGSLDRHWNVEFKSGGFGGERGDNTQANGIMSIQKDIEKLLREEADGFWFHTLEAIDSATLNLVWQSYTQTLRAKANDLINKNDDSTKLQSRVLVFHICVLRQGFSIERRVELNPENIDQSWLRDINVPQFNVTRRTVKRLEDHGWKVTLFSREA